MNFFWIKETALNKLMSIKRGFIAFKCFCMFMWESGFLFIRTFALKNFQPPKPSELHYFS